MAKELSTMHVVAAGLGGIGAGFFLRAMVLPAQGPVDLEPVGVESVDPVQANPPRDRYSELVDVSGVQVPEPHTSGEDQVEASGERTAVEEAPGGLFSIALLAHARAGILEGWGSQRVDVPSENAVNLEIEKFQEWTLALPAKFGKRLAEEEDTREAVLEDAARGGAFTTLTRLDDEGGGPFPDVVRDADLFGKYFPPARTTGTLSGITSLTNDELRKGEPVPDGSVLTFPSGVFELKEFGSYWRKRFPRDLTLRGAGINSTLLVLRDDLRAYDEVSNLRFEGLTVHANGNYFVRVRNDNVLLTLENVRVVGWSGAGSACIFGVGGMMLRAIDCEFLGGYDRNRGGNMFDARTDALMARFERCLISRMKPFQNLRSGGTVVFDRCQIVDAMGGTSPPANVYLDKTSITGWNVDGGQPIERDLNDLFPNWKTNLQR